MTFCLNFLLECCEFEAEDEHTIDNFLLAALDAYEREYATAPAQPIEQPHLQSAFTSPTPITNQAPSDLSLHAPVSEEDIVKAQVESVPKETREDTEYCVKNGAITTYNTLLPLYNCFQR